MDCYSECVWVMGVIFGQKNSVNFSPLFWVLWNVLLSFFLSFSFLFLKVYVKELGTISEQSFSSFQSYCLRVEEVEGLNRKELCVDKPACEMWKKITVTCFKMGVSPTLPYPGGQFESWGRFTVNSLGRDVFLISHCFAATGEMLDFILVDFFSARLQSK